MSKGWRDGQCDGFVIVIPEEFPKSMDAALCHHRSLVDKFNRGVDGVTYDMVQRAKDDLVKALAAIGQSWAI